MNRKCRVAVASRSFSRNRVLRGELLEQYEHVTFNDAGVSLEGDALIEFLRGHEKAIIALERLSEDVLDRLPELRAVAKYGVGLDMLDLDAMRRRGVRLGWTPGVNRRSVSEQVVAVAIGMLRNLFAANREVRDGIWQQHVGGLLSGRTIGIVGLGHVGKDLVQLLQPFGCTLLANDLLDFSAFCARHGVRQSDLRDVLGSADVVTLHVPLDESTRGLFSDEVLGWMRPGAYLVNTARGGIVDEGALKSRLKDGRIAGAAFDVFVSEPPEDLELVNLPNFFVTPHLGGSAAEAILAMGRAAIAGLDGPDLLSDPSFKG